MAELTRTQIVLAALSAPELPRTHGAMRLRLAGLDLRGLDLSGLNLSGADFSRSRMQGCDLRQCDLAGARFHGTDLTDADLAEACLEEGTSFSKANLTRARLSAAYAAGVQMEECDCTDAQFDDARFDGARFVGLVLRRTNLLRASFHGTKIGLCRWDDAVVEDGGLDFVKWTGGAKPPAAWRGVDPQGASARPTQGRPFEAILTDRLAPGAAGDSAPPRAKAA